MRVEDIDVQNRRLWVRLCEKGGKVHALPCRHMVEEYLMTCLDSAGLRSDPRGALSRTLGRGIGRLSDRPLLQARAHAMVRRRAVIAGIATPLGCYSFRATSIAAYLKNGGALETATVIANHASTRTTQLYDRGHDAVSLDEVVVGDHQTRKPGRQLLPSGGGRASAPAGGGRPSHGAGKAATRGTRRVRC